MLLFRPLARYADFRGRASRSEYWLFLTTQGVIYLTCLVLGAMSLGNHDIGAGFMGLMGWWGLALILLLVFCIPNYAVLARRLHDSGRTAKWMALMLPTIASNFVSFQSMIGLARRAPVSGIDGGEAFKQAAMHDLAGVGAIALIASICSLVLFILTLMPGTRGSNKYGADPKNPDGDAATSAPSGWSDDGRLDDLFAQAKRDARAAEGPYKPVFDFGPGPSAAAAPAPAPAPVDWGRPAYDPGVAPSGTFGRRR